MQIKIDPLTNTLIETFLRQHLEDMRAVSPPESCHALDMQSLKHPSVTFWTLWEGDCLYGCGGMKAIDNRHAEIKSMRVAPEHRGKGLASFILEHILQEAKNKGFNRLSLETGSMDFFIPARKLYQNYGFIECAPFGEYKEDPNCVFMTYQITT